jgi:site-specific DNA recombinase
MVVRTAIYTRISFDKNRESQGVERQLEDARDVAARKGWTVLENHVYSKDASASIFAKKPRGEYKKLLDAIEAGELDAVIMAVEDRTHRQVLELAEFIQLCKDHNVKVTTVGTEYDLDDPDQISMWFIKVRFAEAEVEKMSRRLRRQRLQAAQKGQRHIGGRRPFGERGRKRVRNANGDWITVPIVSEAQAERERALIREAARRILAGDSLRGIVSDWNARVIAAPGGGEWLNQVLRKMLLSPRIVGKRTHGAYELRDGKRKRVGETVYDGDPTKLAPILDEQMWKAVKAILEDPSRRTVVGGGQPAHLLTGLLFCGICKRKLRAHVKRNNGKEQRVYYCNPQNARGGNHVTRDADKLDGLIEEALFRAIETDDFQEAATDLQPEDPTKPHVDRMAEITAELDVYGRMALEAEARELQGILPKPGRSLVDIERKIAELEREYEREQTQYQRKKDGRVRAYLPKNIRALWPDYSLDRRRNIIASVTEWIRIHPLPHSNVTDEQFVNAVEWEKKAAAWT